MSHQWLIKALEVAKVPERIITAIKALMKKWSTNANIQYGATSLDSQPIQYLRGIFQGDNLSVLLLILSVNPLSYLLNKLKLKQVNIPFPANLIFQWISWSNSTLLSIVVFTCGAHKLNYIKNDFV